MKLFYLFTIISILVLPTTHVKAELNKLYSNKGYPYNLLISRTDSVKIFYSVKEEDIHCRVEINWDNNKVVSDEVQIENKAFDDMPLASCLTRKQAKTILASTFDFDPSKLLANSIGL